MKVSQLARAAGVTSDTVRHYVKLGLLRSHRDPTNGYRVFQVKDLSRLRFVRRAQQLGYRLGEIRSIFALADAGHSPCPEVRAIIARRIDKTSAMVRELQLLQRRMESAARRWSNERNEVPTGDSICHLIENWDRPNSESDSEND